MLVCTFLSCDCMSFCVSLSKVNDALPTCTPLCILGYVWVNADEYGSNSSGDELPELVGLMSFASMDLLRLTARRYTRMRSNSFRVVQGFLLGARGNACSKKSNCNFVISNSNFTFIRLPESTLPLHQLSRGGTYVTPFDVYSRLPHVLEKRKKVKNN